MKDIKIGQKVRINNGPWFSEIGKLKGFNYHRTKKGTIGLGGTLCLVEVEGSKYFSLFGLLRTVRGHLVSLENIERVA